MQKYIQNIYRNISRRTVPQYYSPSHTRVTAIKCLIITQPSKRMKTACETNSSTYSTTSTYDRIPETLNTGCTTTSAS